MADILTLVSATIQDNLGVKAPNLTYWLSPDGATLSVLLQFYARTYAQYLDAITDGYISRFAVEFLPNPITDYGATIKTAAVIPSRVEETALFNFSQDGSRYKAPVDVPAVAQAVLTGSGSVDLTNADVTNYIGVLTAAGPASEQPVSKYEYDLLALLDAAQTFRKRRRQLNKVTFEPGP
jgi:hypothetical protein